MRRFILLLFACVNVVYPSLMGQATFAEGATERNPLFNPMLKPFYNGVASGQPTTDGFVIWTRLDPDFASPTELSYLVAEDPGFQQIVQSGQAAADADRDYTVHIPISGLQSDKYYYYCFRHTEGNSLIGRAKTLPTSTDHVRLAVASCANYETGYFNAYGAIAARNDLDAVVHLGDYIYEAETGAYGQPTGTRVNEPPTEIIALADYRRRYDLYRLDPDLIRMHQQHTIISVWDDHESANGSWQNGASNHQPNEGDWATRKAIAKQVWHEWMPVFKTDDSPIYQRIRFGALADLLMLDTRIEGREQPPAHFDTPDVPARKIISQTQMDWLSNRLKSNDTQWKLLGNQVVFSDLNVGFLAGALDGTSDPSNIDSLRQVEDVQNDNWEAYPTQRAALIDTITQNNLRNVVILSGDSHSSWAFDVATKPMLYPLAQNNYIPLTNPYQPGLNQGYDAVTQAGTHAVEFCVPSVSSPNFDEAIGFFPANILESVINKPIASLGVNYNPHLRYVDLDRHGYYVLNVRPDTTQADYFYMSTISQANLTETYAVSTYTLRGDPKVRLAYTPSANKPSSALPTPTLPFGTVSTQVADMTIRTNRIWPNPTQGLFTVEYQLNRPANAVWMSVYSASGQRLIDDVAFKQPKGQHRKRFDLTEFEGEVFFVRLSANGEQHTLRVVKSQ